jgi:hypothetical protein
VMVVLNAWRLLDFEESAREVDCASPEDGNIYLFIYSSYSMQPAGYGRRGTNK